MARAEARYQEDAWRSHRMFCPQCSRAARSRKWAGLCVQGADIRTARDQARRELDLSRQLDMLPPPGQGVLF